MKEKITKEYPEAEIREEAVYLYRLFLFEAGIEKDTNIQETPALSADELSTYIKSRINQEYALWEKNWTSMEKSYNKSYPEGDSELHYAALKYLKEKNNFKSIHQEVQSQMQTNPVSSGRSEVQKDISDMGIPNGLN